MRNPPKGFEEVVREHFRVIKPRLRQQCKAWLADFPMAGDIHRENMIQVVAEVNAELDKI